GIPAEPVWFLLPRVARLMIHTPTAISIFVCLSMVQLMAVFISMRCTLCGHFLRSEERRVGKECRSRGWPDHSEIKDGRRRLRMGLFCFFFQAEDGIRDRSRHSC